MGAKLERIFVYGALFKSGQILVVGQLLLCELTKIDQNFIFCF